MSWGSRVLDQEAFAEQQRQETKESNPWGSRMGLPTEEPVAEVPAVEPTGEVVTNPPPPAVAMTVKEVEASLKADQQTWPRLLEVEMARPDGGRVTAFKALRIAAEDTGADPTTILQIGRLIGDVSEVEETGDETVKE